MAETNPMKPEHVTVCPNCKSTDVAPDKDNKLIAMGAPLTYVCANCGHTGYSFPEVDLEELDDFEKEVHQQILDEAMSDDSPKVDVSYGAFVVRIIWKLTGPLMLLAGIYLLGVNTIVGIVAILLGLFMIYAAYFHKHIHN